MKHLTKKDGFTLIELAIVMILIGVLVVGITAGVGMIQQAELRSFITDLRFYKVAYNNFFGRYNKIPGDMEFASAYFPACAETNTNCNGDNDGVIECALTTANDEISGVWSQMNQAGVMAGGIRTTLDSANGGLVIGLDSPAASRSGTGLFIAGPGAGILACNGSTADTSPFTVDNAVFLGGGNFVDAAHISGAVDPSEAYTLDIKIDDAYIDDAGDFVGANSGKFRAIEGDGSAANTCDNAGAYTVSNTSKDCIVGLAVN